MLATCILALVLAGAARAGDGVIEINQVRALEGGVSASDAPGFPVTIEAGSYRLTSDLVVPDVNTDGIVRGGSTAAPATLDLGGFAIRGPAGCGGQPVGTFSCAATGTGVGIDGVFLSVRNGAVHGMGSHGIEGFSGRVEGVDVWGNGGFGIVGAGLHVSNCHVNQNAAGGIAAYSNANSVRGCFVERNNGAGIDAQNALVESNVVSESGSTGIRVSGRSTVARNVVGSSLGTGIELGSSCAAIENDVSDSGQAGITGSGGNLVHANTVTGSRGGPGIQLLGSGNDVTGNIATDNAGDGIFSNGGSNVSDNVARGNTAHGISVNGPSRVFGNTSTGNTRRGLRMQTNVGYAQNVLEGNSEGPIQDGVSMGANLCGTGLCPTP